MARSKKKGGAKGRHSPPRPQEASAAAAAASSYGATGGASAAAVAPPQQSQPEPPRQRPPSFCSDLLGWETLQLLPRDGRLLLAARGLRMCSFGLLAVVLVLHLKAAGLPESRIGLLFTLTLLGDAGVSLFMTTYADVLGRRRMLRIGALLKCVTGVVFASTSNFYVLLIAGIVGVLSPGGRELGPFLPIEHAALTRTIDAAHRTRLFAWHNLVGSCSSAVGALLGGTLVTFLTEGSRGLSDYQAYRIVLCLYSAIGLLMFLLFSCVSPAVEPATGTGTVKATPVGQFLGLHESKWLVLRLSLLFMIDSFAGGFILQSLLANWFAVTWDTKPSVLGTMLFICNLVAGISALFAAKLARLVGLISTMVFTHLPSNIMMILIPLMPTELGAIALLCIRFCISQMDVPTRNSYTLAVVQEDERSAAGGVTNIVRSLGASFSPSIAGMLYENPATRNCPFYIAGGLKIAYDLLLLGAFASVKPPEERGGLGTTAGETAPLKGVTVKI